MTVTCHSAALGDDVIQSIILGHCRCGVAIHDNSTPPIFTQLHFHIRAVIVAQQRKSKKKVKSPDMKLETSEIIFTLDRKQSLSAQIHNTTHI